MTGNALNDRGFTLVEMALVLLIIGLLARTAIAPLAGMQEHRKRRQAEQQVLDVREALFAHVVAYGALPCPLPASLRAPTLSQQHTPDAGGAGDAFIGDIAPSPTVCKVSSGVVPANKLRLTGAVSTSGALLDPWGQAYRYAVSLSKDTDDNNARWPHWTTAGEAARVGIAKLSADIVLCHTSSSGNCSGRAVRADQIAFVVLSTGRDTSADGAQAENLDEDNYFLATDESIAQGNQYDDIMSWGSAADVMYWMLRMGWLP